MITEPAVLEPAFDRLLQMAVEVFAEYGFREATVREICTRANVNVASVNYYFRSKEALYVQAIQFALQEVNRLYPQDAALDKSLPPEQRLALFIGNFLHKLLDDSHLGFHSKLITREIADPTKALDEIMTTAIAPQCALLEEIIQKILGSQADKTKIRRCMLSILGQCLMFKHSRSIIDRLYPEVCSDSLAIHDSAIHIAQFSLAALNVIARQQERQDL
jgi:AcrR family transcriptional regulator